MSTSRKKITKNFTESIAPFTSVHVGSRLEFFPTEIVMIQADISYSFLYLKNGQRIIVSTNIQKLEERFLPFRNMVRIHRSFMINTQFLKYVEGSNAFLINDMQCVISRRKRNDLFQSIQILNS
ncbi:LytR/AlgR family response regulator transcription factor [Lacihabitans soyangensis]|uniref:LytTR family transcriptional regulator n=1 Tax=Lacihabitans soyangensis TaxID=869394 RepID=A0AAE3H2S9_9BACT|nr:LytTR family DNA-binding domain-containing protein [Lacihabitans soyangensis]MCP9763572.1 LytTR family transcriptional regulator [Lacihabitans soyangensis]